MLLLPGYADFLSIRGKIVFDGMLLMQKDPTLGIPILHKFLGILLEIVAIRLSLGNFWKPNVQSARQVLCSNHDPFGQCEFPNLSGNGYHLLVWCIPPIFIRYERTLILSTWKWIDLRLNTFEKVKRASLMANNSRTTLIWSFDSWRDH